MLNMLYLTAGVTYFYLWPLARLSPEIVIALVPDRSGFEHVTIICSR
jgi:hypothetical protein